MTKDEALAFDLALEALKELVAQTEARLFAIKHDHVALQNAREAITAIKQARSAPVQEPDAFDDDIEVTGPTTIRTRYRLEVGTKLYTTPPAAQPAPVQPVSGYIKKIEDLIQERDDARSSRDFYKRRADALQEWQSKMRDPERTIVCDILANGHTLEPAGDRYTPPAAQRQWVGLTDDQIRGLTPKPDGVAEGNVRRVEVLPGVMGTEFDEVDAWSMPLVLQIARAIEAKLKEKNT
jgi:hypothetical protein